MTKVHHMKEKKEDESKVVFNNESKFFVGPLH
jgi:hypothetical protein